MHIAPAASFACPLDGLPLARRFNSFVCANGHSFDRGREGYVNLLPVQDKASRDPGDSKAMVAARRRFLAAGAYAPIASTLADLTVEAIARRGSADPFTILDAGCGEGYYLEALAHHLATHVTPATIRLAGIDISKWAVRSAAKRAMPAALAVASNRRPPFAATSTDLIVCLFGFPVWPGFAAIQPAHGEVILADPGPDHLLELREIIYPEVRRKEGPSAANAEGYTLVAERRLKASAHVPSRAGIADLLTMTPHAHRAGADGLAALAAFSSLDMTIDVIFRTFRRES